VPGPILASAGSDWSYGGSILTFLFPMILFLAVAGVLWVGYTKPQHVPGRSYLASGRSVSATTAVTAGSGAAGTPGMTAGHTDPAAGSGPGTPEAGGAEAGE
jgi:hypothetical protein